ncbi:MAG: AAA family ATPase [Pseudomonas sp.]|nr:AAA family ATPase [Pseudomonas sp.]
MDLKNALSQKNKNEESINLNLAPLEASNRVQKVSELSLKAEIEIKNIYSQVDLFISELSGFITDKQFVFIGGVLTIESSRNIDIFKLSSGEKQLLILLIEVLLQRNKPYIYLTDEPEISLHIEWQRKIIPTVKKLNTSAQIIVATHSPEVASKYKESIINMKDITCLQG